MRRYDYTCQRDQEKSLMLKPAWLPCQVVDTVLCACAQTLAYSRLDVPSAWFHQQQHYGSLVLDWLMHLWPDNKLATLHAQLHLHETQLAAGVMLLKQMAALGQQHASRLPADLAQRQLSSFIIETLWSATQAAAQQAAWQIADAATLQQAT